VTVEASILGSYNDEHGGFAVHEEFMAIFHT
jgi:hypothetical protein